ncbi:STAS domain-containing protein [bacterium]|nr:STAS domain-containing protein [bacterium]
MKMKEIKKGDVLVLKLEGELMGGEGSQIVQDRIYKAIEENTIDVVLDMGGIKWMNSAGLGIIMASITTLRGSGGDLKLANVNKRVLRPIEITKLDRVIEMFKAVDQAVESFASGG